uniref:Uncharacterized protein n=1 Tax=Triticum urartu TaxID=4572 RepID=A0A8R7V6A4_TRIUA
MSFLAGRLAAQEGAYFLQESRNAAGRLAQKLPAPEHGPRPASPPPSADVLPEILRHSMPLRPTLPPPNSTLYGSTRLALPPGGAEAAGVAPDVLSPLRSYVALPQATFGLGPKRFHVDLFTDGNFQLTGLTIHHQAPMRGGMICILLPWTLRS